MFFSTLTAIRDAGSSFRSCSSLVPTPFLWPANAQVWVCSMAEQFGLLQEELSKAWIGKCAFPSTVYCGSIAHLPAEVVSVPEANGKISQHPARQVELHWGCTEAHWWNISESRRDTEWWLPGVTHGADHLPFPTACCFFQFLFHPSNNKKQALGLH